jgi:hypothetical protein
MPTVSYHQLLILSLGEWLHTAPNNTGTVAKTARTKNREIIIGPLFGSALKIWLISASFPYRSGFSICGRGTFGSAFSSRLKTWLLNAWVDPKDARRRVARSGWEERTN